MSAELAYGRTSLDQVVCYWYVAGMEAILLNEYQRLGQSGAHHAPAYLRLRRAIRSSVEHGAVEPGQALPSERELSRQLALSRVTVRKAIAGPVIVLVPAILFSLYHYLGPEHFSLQSFVFRTLAGVYFGIVFLCRGFGITAGAHSAYDILIVLLSRLAMAHG